MARQSFFRGALVLGAASITTNFLGMIIQVVFARELGAEGFGLFNAVNPIIYAVITVATMALPTALAKVIAEALAVGDVQKVKFSMKFSITVVAILSITLSIATIIAAPIITTKWMDPRTFYLVLAAVFRIPIVCLSSIIYGYYMGIQNQTPPAIGWIIETAIRTVITVPLIFWANQFGLVYGAMAVIIGHGIGELAGLLYMFRLYRHRDSVFPDVPKHLSTMESKSATVRALAEVAVPTTLRNILGLIAYAAEPIIVYLAFAKIGVDKGHATSLYGSISMAFQLLLIPTVLSSSLSTILVPAVSEAVAMRNDVIIRRRLYQILRVTLMIGFPSTAVFLLMGRDVASSLYGDGLAGALLAYLAPICVFAYIQDPLFGILQGLNKATLATVVSVGSSVIRMYGIYYFVSKPGLGVFGIANAAAIAAIITTLITFYCVQRYVHIHISVLDTVKMVICTALFTYVVYQIKAHVIMNSKVSIMIVAITCGSAIYALSLLLTRVVRTTNVERIPGVGFQLARVLRLIPFVR